MADISKHVDKSYEQMSFEQLADAPVDALQGVSQGDAELFGKSIPHQNDPGSCGK